MNILYPNIPAARLPAMLRTALAGALIAAAYGAIHDQISFAISPEYFIRMKFHQFHWADVGLPPRAFASVVGVLATWWAGLIAGWVLARIGLDRVPPESRVSRQRRAFAIILISTAITGTLGALIGLLMSRGDLSGWAPYRDAYVLRDVPGFVIVAWLHASGYLGAFLGLVIAAFKVRHAAAAR